MRRTSRVNWKRNKEADYCENTACLKAFSLLNRRHHCRNCGGLFCRSCTKAKIPLPHIGYSSSEKVCEACFQKCVDAKVDITAPVKPDTLPNPTDVLVCAQLLRGVAVDLSMVRQLGIEPIKSERGVCLARAPHLRPGVLYVAFPSPSSDLTGGVLERSDEETTLMRNVVHLGLLSELKVQFGALQNAIKAAGEAPRIIFCGHGVGGSHAIITLAELFHTLRPATAEAITFGAPPCLRHFEISSHPAPRLTNFVHNFDPLPRWSSAGFTAFGGYVFLLTTTSDDDPPLAAVSVALPSPITLENSTADEMLRYVPRTEGAEHLPLSLASRHPSGSLARGYYPALRGVLYRPWPKAVAPVLPPPLLHPATPAPPLGWPEGCIPLISRVAHPLSLEIDDEVGVDLPPFGMCECITTASRKAVCRMRRAGAVRSDEYPPACIADLQSRVSLWCADDASVLFSLVKAPSLSPHLVGVGEVAVHVTSSRLILIPHNPAFPPVCHLLKNIHAICGPFNTEPSEFRGGVVVILCLSMLADVRHSVLQLAFRFAEDPSGLTTVFSSLTTPSIPNLDRVLSRGSDEEKKSSIRAVLKAKQSRGFYPSNLKLADVMTQDLWQTIQPYLRGRGQPRGEGMRKTASSPAPSIDQYSRGGMTEYSSISPSPSTRSTRAAEFEDEWVLEFAIREREKHPDRTPCYVIDHSPLLGLIVWEGEWSRGGTETGDADGEPTPPEEAADKTSSASSVGPSTNSNGTQDGPLTLTKMVVAGDSGVAYHQLHELSGHYDRTPGVASWAVEVPYPIVPDVLPK